MQSEELIYRLGMEEHRKFLLKRPTVHDIYPNHCTAFFIFCKQLLEKNEQILPKRFVSMSMSTGAFFRRADIF